MTVIDEQARRCQDAVALGVISKEALARKAGLRPTTLQLMMESDWNPTRKTLSALVGVLDEMGFVVPSRLRASEPA